MIKYVFLTVTPRFRPGMTWRGVRLSIRFLSDVDLCNSANIRIDAFQESGTNKFVNKALIDTPIPVRGITATGRIKPDARQERSPRIQRVIVPGALPVPS